MKGTLTIFRHYCIPGKKKKSKREIYFGPVEFAKDAQIETEGSPWVETMFYHMSPQKGAYKKIGKGKTRGLIVMIDYKKERGMFWSSFSFYWKPDFKGILKATGTNMDQRLRSRFNHYSAYLRIA